MSNPDILSADEVINFISDTLKECRGEQLAEMYNSICADRI